MCIDHPLFAIIGVAGYIAPRHLKAIQTLGYDLIIAHDTSDSVGIIDHYFPNTYFTTDKNDFFNRIVTERIDCLTVCTPNYLHCPHTIRGLEAGVDVICEKPLTLTRNDLYRMETTQQVTGHRIWPILQLRLHPEIIKLKQAVESEKNNKIYDIDLTYITPRGKWYAASWKGDPLKSGGLTANIGIHFIDMLHWIFGPAERVTVHHAAPDCSAGFLQMKNARVRYFLSVDPKLRPSSNGGPMSPYRHMTIDGKEFDFTNGFTDLHTVSYRRIFENRGFSIDDVKASIDTLDAIRHAPVTGLIGDYHPFVRKL